MEMELKEALRRLERAGLICEDIYDNEEELAAIEDEMQKGADAFKRAASTTSQEWRTKHMNDVNKHQSKVSKLQRQYRERHPSLSDKIAAAKEYNERNAPNKWEGLSTKEKIAALRKLVEEDGLTFKDENPLNPDSSDIFADFYDIPELADVWDKATEKLEDIYLSDEDNWSSGWDDWLFSYGDDILLDILKGKKVKQIVDEYESSLD